MSIPAIVLYLGPEEGEKLAAIGEIRTAMKQHHGEGLEEHTFYAFETPADQVVSLLQNGSLFGSGTLVRYRSIEHLKRKDEIAPLTSYAKAPSDGAVLVLESGEVSVAKALEQAAGGKNKRIFWEMFDNQKQGWLQGYFRRRKVDIQPEAVELMLELVQNNTLDLRQEADRLIAYVGDRITTEDVDRYIYHAREETVFSLFDAVIAQDLDHALDIAAKLMAGGDAMQIVLGLSWQLDRLYHLQALRQAGVGEKQLFDELNRLTGQRINSKRVQKNLLAAMHAYAPGQCAAMKLLVGEVDALMRTVPTALHASLVQQFLYGLIARKGAWSLVGRHRPGLPWEFPGVSTKMDTSRIV